MIVETYAFCQALLDTVEITVFLLFALIRDPLENFPQCTNFLMNSPKQLHTFLQSSLIVSKKDFVIHSYLDCTGSFDG